MNSASPTDQAIRPNADEFQAELGRRPRWIAMFSLIAISMFLAILIVPHTLVYLTLGLVLALQLRLANVMWGVLFLGLIGLFRFMDSRVMIDATVFSEGLLALLFVTHLIFSCRYAQTVRYAQAFDIDTSNRAALTWVMAVRAALPAYRLMPLLVTMLAGMLLAFIPESYYSVNRFGLRPEWGRLILLTFVLFFPWYFMRAGLALMARFQVSPAVADLTSRAMVNSEAWREMAGVESRKAKLVRDASES